MRGVGAAQFIGVEEARNWRSSYSIASIAGDFIIFYVALITVSSPTKEQIRLLCFPSLTLKGWNHFHNSGAESKFLGYEDGCFLAGSSLKWCFNWDSTSGH